jgi:hypothetical protein
VWLGRQRKPPLSLRTTLPKKMAWATLGSCGSKVRSTVCTGWQKVVSHGGGNGRPALARCHVRPPSLLWKTPLLFVPIAMASRRSGGNAIETTRSGVGPRKVQVTPPSRLSYRPASEPAPRSVLFHSRASLAK